MKNYLEQYELMREQIIKNIFKKWNQAGQMSLKIEKRLLKLHKFHIKLKDDFLFPKDTECFRYLNGFLNHLKGRKYGKNINIQ